MDNTDLYLGLLNFRNTPRNKILKSPNERLMSRITRSPIPTTEKMLKPRIVHGVRKELMKLRHLQKKYADRGTKEGKQLQPGDKVRVQIEHRHWEEGEVTQGTGKPRSYMVKTADGQYRRNSAHLHETKATIIKPVNVTPHPIEIAEPQSITPPAIETKESSYRTSPSNYSLW